MFECKILADSLSPQGVRLTTFQCTFPRSILAEFDTHRMLSRNAASSRAIPNKKLIEMVMEDPFLPEFRLNQKGMQAAEMLQSTEAFKAGQVWLDARNSCVAYCQTLHGLEIHKQYINRLLEPWMFCTVVVSATDWDNFFHLRCHEAAEPSFQVIAKMMKEEMEKSEPKNGSQLLCEDELQWHLPMVDFYDNETWKQYDSITYELIVDCIKEKCPQFIDNYTIERFTNYLPQDISAGRVTKVSYNNLDTGKIDLANDVRLAVQMSCSNPGHWSPFEHIATPANPEGCKFSIDQLEVKTEYRGGENSPKAFETQRHFIGPKDGEVGYCGNFRGWKQYRKFFSGENYIGK